MRLPSRLRSRLRSRSMPSFMTRSCLRTFNKSTPFSSVAPPPSHSYSQHHSQHQQGLARLFLASALRLNSSNSRISTSRRSSFHARFDEEDDYDDAANSNSRAFVHVLRHSLGGWGLPPNFDDDDNDDAFSASLPAFLRDVARHGVKHAAKRHTTPACEKTRGRRGFLLPDTQGCYEDGAHLAYPRNQRPARTFKNQATAASLAHTFKDLERAPISRHRLGRYGLHHAHVFVNEIEGCRGERWNVSGLLYHAAEYPAYDDDCFPYNLGRCQLGSTLHASNTTLARRNAFLVYAEREETQGSPNARRLCLAVLDASADGPYHALAPAEKLHTADESWFGGGENAKHAEVAYVNDTVYLIV